MIIKAIKKSKEVKCLGPDGVPSIVLKNCASSLVKPLCWLFNKSLETGHFPSAWKITNITPIFKSSQRDNIANYRGIAILGAIPKLFELVVYEIISCFVESRVSNNQHGFFKNRSILTNLLSTTHAIHKAFDEKLQMDVI